MSKDKFQDQYKEVFQELKEEKMEWSFEDFLQKAEDQDVTPIVDLKKKPLVPKWFWMAASLVLLGGLGWFYQQSQDTGYKDQLVQKEILKQKADFINENEEETDAFVSIVADSLVEILKDSIAPIKVLAERDELENLISNKSRIKKERKPKYVSNSSFKDTLTSPEAYVIVNGKKITNKQEAIDIAEYSLLKLREKFKNTVATSQNGQSWNNDY